MLSYKHFPPIENFEKILKYYPESALLYAQIHSQKDEKNHLTVSKEHLRNHFHISKALFRNHCLTLSGEGFLTFLEKDEYFIIDLIK